MTLTLLLGGMLWFGLAYRLVWGRAASEKATRFSGTLLAALGPAIAALMIWFALQEGAMIASAPDTAGRLAGQTRVALLEATINRTDMTRQLTIGGDPAMDDLIVRDLPAGAVSLAEVEGVTQVRLNARASGDARTELFVDGVRVKPSEARDSREAVTIVVARIVSRMPSREAIPEKIDDLPKSRTRMTIDRRKRAWHVTFALPELKLASGGNVQPASADLENQPRDGDNIIAFKTLGGTFAPLLEQVELVLPQAAGLSTYVSGSRPGYQDNQRVVIEGAGLGIVLRVDPLNLTSGLRGYAGGVAMLVLLASAILHWRVRRDSPLTAMLLGIAEVLLVLRIIIALEGGMVEETMRSRGALSDALVALPLGLLAIGAAVSPLRRVPVQLLALGGAAAAVLALVGAVNHGIPNTSWQVAIALMALTVVAVALNRLLPRLLNAEIEERTGERLGKLGTGLAGRASSVLSRAGQAGIRLRDWGARWQRPEWASRSWLTPIAVSYGAGVLLLLARSILVVFDIEERLLGDSGSGGALSIVFVPLNALAIAPLLRQLSRSEGGPQLLASGMAFAGFLLFFVLAPNAVANDMGQAVVLILGLAIAGAGGRLALPPAAGWREWLAAALTGFAIAHALAGFLADNSGWWIVPLILLALVLILQLWMRSAEALGTLIWMAPAATLIAIVLLTAIPQLRPGMEAPPGDTEAMLVSDTSSVRLIAALAPERFDFLLSQRAADLREAINYLEHYVEAPEGRRMLNLPLPPPGLKKQQFSDYVVALHVISPFGRLAAVGLLLMLAGLSTLAFARIAERRGIAWFGVLAVIIFASTSTYIALANTLLAPFTGRNFYLLAVQSHSDLVEGLLLLVLAGATLCTLRPGVQP